MKKYFLLSCLLVLNTPYAFAKDLKIAIGLSLPPYFIEGKSEGIEFEIIKEALAVKGHTFKPEYLPFARVTKAIADKAVDGAATINEGSGIQTNYTNEHVTYQNYAITLKEKAFQIASVNDLNGKSIAAFQNAKKYLGPDFAKMADANKAYAEHATQQTQNKLLFSKRVDVVVGDKNIFNHFTKEIAKEVNTTQELVFHPIFPATPYKMGFTDAQIRDDFNEGLKQIKANGVYQKILDKYSK